MNKKLIAAVLVIAVLILFISLCIGKLILKKSFRRLEMTPGRVDAIYEYGLILYSKEDYDRATRAFEIVGSQDIDLDKKEDVLLKLADIYERKDKLQEAKACYKKLIKDFPNSEYISKVEKHLESINMEILFSPVITEQDFMYEIKSNDTLGKIAKKFGTTVELLKQSNNLKSDIIIPGNQLKVTKARFSVLVDKSQNILFLKENDEIVKTYKVSTGSNNSTPVGKYRIEEKLISPVWYKIGAIVEPDSPEYELGKYWMGISKPGYGIHGTKDPSTIGRHITRGCVRMLNDDIEELFTILPSGAEVVIVD